MIGGSLPENESYFTVGAARDATGPSERGRRDADVREKVTKEATVLIIGVRAPYNADKGRRPGSAARDAIRRFCFYPASSSRLDRVLSPHGSRLYPRTPTALPPSPRFPRQTSPPPSPISKNISSLPFRKSKIFLGGWIFSETKFLDDARMHEDDVDRRRRGEKRSIPHTPHPPPPSFPTPSTFAVRFEFACQSPLPSNFLHAIARYWNCLVGDLSPSVIYFLNRACLPTCLPTYLPTSTFTCPADWLADWLAAWLTDCRPLRHTT